MTCRVDIMQDFGETEADGEQKWTHVISSNFMMAARSKATGAKFLLPVINFEHSDSVSQAKVRHELSKETVSWLKTTPRSEIYCQPPTEKEFDMI